MVNISQLSIQQQQAYSYYKDRPGEQIPLNVAKDLHRLGLLNQGQLDASLRQYFTDRKIAGDRARALAPSTEMKRERYQAAKREAERRASTPEVIETARATASLQQQEANRRATQQREAVRQGAVFSGGERNLQSQPEAIKTLREQAVQLNLTDIRKQTIGPQRMIPGVTPGVFGPPSPTRDQLSGLYNTPRGEQQRRNVKEAIIGRRVASSEYVALNQARKEAEYRAAAYEKQQQTFQKSIKSYPVLEGIAQIPASEFSSVEKRFGELEANRLRGQAAIRRYEEAERIAMGVAATTKEPSAGGRFGILGRPLSKIIPSEPLGEYTPEKSLHLHRSLILGLSAIPSPAQPIALGLLGATATSKGKAAVEPAFRKSFYIQSGAIKGIREDPEKALLTAGIGFGLGAAGATLKAGGLAAKGLKVAGAVGGAYYIGASGVQIYNQPSEKQRYELIGRKAATEVIPGIAGGVAGAKFAQSRLAKQTNIFEQQKISTTKPNKFLTEQRAYGELRGESYRLLGSKKTGSAYSFEADIGKRLRLTGTQKGKVTELTVKPYTVNKQGKMVYGKTVFEGQVKTPKLDLPRTKMIRPEPETVGVVKNLEGQTITQKDFVFFRGGRQGKFIPGRSGFPDLVADQKIVGSMRATVKTKVLYPKTEYELLNPELKSIAGMTREFSPLDVSLSRGKALSAAAQKPLVTTIPMGARGTNFLRKSEFPLQVSSSAERVITGSALLKYSTPVKPSILTQFKTGYDRLAFNVFRSSKQGSLLMLADTRGMLSLTGSTGSFGLPTVTPAPIITPTISGVSIANPSVAAPFVFSPSQLLLSNAGLIFPGAGLAGLSGAGLSGLAFRADPRYNFATRFQPLPSSLGISRVESLSIAPITPATPTSIGGTGARPDVGFGPATISRFVSGTQPIIDVTPTTPQLPALIAPPGQALLRLPSFATPRFPLPFPDVFFPRIGKGLEGSNVGGGYGFSYPSLGGGKSGYRPSLAGIFSGRKISKAPNVANPLGIRYPVGLLPRNMFTTPKRRKGKKGKRLKGLIYV